MALTPEIEKTSPTSCLNRAAADEPVFTLLGRDPVAPTYIRAWAVKRIELGKNKPGDPQVTEAVDLAAAMEAWRLKNRPA